MIKLQLDVGDRFEEAKIYRRENPERTLADFIRTYTPRFPKDRMPSEAERAMPLSRFLFEPVTLQEDVCAPPDPRPDDSLKKKLDGLWEQDQAGEPVCGLADADDFSDKMNENKAVQTAYAAELGAVIDFLKKGLSVLVLCDKMLTEYIYPHVCPRAGLNHVTEDKGQDNARKGAGGRLDDTMQGASNPLSGLPLLLRNLKEKDILVLRSLDMIDTPPMIEQLYHHTGTNKQPQILAFLDPSLEAKKVLTDRFSVHVGIMGLPRYVAAEGGGQRQGVVHCVSRLLTQAERGCFKDYDPEGLYKNVAGLNAVQFRNAMRYVGAKVAAGTDSREIYRLIRGFKTSSSGEIEIPDTGFDDIGGYDHIKHQLKRIISLIGGPIQGMDEKQRGRLIPRGFVFHGPPGTGKTLFAKAIANEMNATIQMISGPEIMDKYVGESENKLRRIFATARRNAPAVVFFDEFDSIAAQRSNYADGGARANNAVVAQLLTELDGFRQEQTVLVIGTTNRIDIIDEALLRPSRLRPLEIGRPDPAARRRVAAIHAKTFRTEQLMKDLCGLAAQHLDAWEKSGPDDSTRKVPDGFLESLFALHPPYAERCRLEDRRAGFIREIREFFAFISTCQQDAENPPPMLDQLKERVIGMARRYGLDMEAGDLPAPGSPEEEPLLAPMRADIRDLFTLLAREKDKGLTPENVWRTLLDLTAEYTEKFNNDEIRAVFQEAGLEHHMEGQLITPRYIGRKIGLIRKRRDEREAVHIGRRERQHEQ